jgi:ribose transport system substrate-binding protein
MAAARGIRDDLVVTTVDLGANVALSIARDGIVKGLGSQLPYHQGVAEAIVAAYSLLGKDAPSFVALPALRVTKENLAEAWRTVYRVDAPQEVLDALK